MKIETEPRYCSVCEEGLEAKDLDGICGDCYKKAKGGKPVEVILDSNALALGIGYGVVSLLQHFLRQRPTSSEMEPDGDGQECFRAWCDRIGMPY